MTYRETAKLAIASISAEQQEYLPPAEMLLVTNESARIRAENSNHLLPLVGCTSIYIAG
jgi:hypothetical protein